MGKKDAAEAYIADFNDKVATVKDEIVGIVGGRTVSILAAAELGAPLSPDSLLFLYGRLFRLLSLNFGLNVVVRFFTHKKPLLYVLNTADSLSDCILNKKTPYKAAINNSA